MSFYEFLGGPAAFGRQFEGPPPGVFDTFPYATLNIEYEHTRKVRLGRVGLLRVGSGKNAINA